MNIAYLSNSIIPSTNANSVQVMKTCEALAKVGNNVSLVGRMSYDKINYNNDEITEYYGIQFPFEIKHFYWPSIRLLGGVMYSEKVYRHYKRLHKPDIFYGRDSYSLIKVSSFGKPIFLEAHSIPENKYKTNNLKKLFKKKNFKGLIVTSQSLKISYLKLYPFLEESNVFVVRNAASVPKIQSNENITLGKCNTPKVGYVGSLKSGKGIEMVLTLSKKMNNVEFHVVGGSETQINRFQRTNTNKNIYFHGFVNNARLSEYYSEFDILIAPYPEVKIKNYKKTNNISIDKWASPLKILEYMSYKKPIIASDLPMIKETLTHNVNSLLCSPNKTECWVSAINLLIENPLLRKKLSNRAYDSFEKNYTWDNRAKELFEIFNNKNN